MVKRLILIASASFFIVLSACKNSTEETLVEVPEDVSVSEAIQKRQNQTEFYVMAASGLSLRKSNTTKSDKLAVMPYGSMVIVKPQTTQTSISVDHIEGVMQAAVFNGLEGYCFSGYLSPYPMPVKGVSVEDYIEQLKAKDAAVTYEQKENGPDFHQGYSEFIKLPNVNWHEAYYIAQNLFEIPRSLVFPNPSGITSEIIEEPTKPKDVWSSDLTVKRTSNQLDTITYSWRAEGSGYGVIITRPDLSQLQIEHFAFAD